ncbi:hypothetical protein BFP72_00390 [Reichenbachiella sp. 5M10]|uniref:DUF6377 domain-containing protein n=1 Tax=Reichenbachiella sp. 5M10 TaxID=1889772 RepID=UPI000C15C988|nr:DUF6377 domain-containing protein [Reichenbachiella sp. 5M10]PIB33997.1 hypothetical protein BFP72_00390 [Reichenbachiella sp. 5M10]
MKGYILILFLALTCWESRSAYAKDLLEQLNSSLEQKDVYTAERLSKIDKLRKRLYANQGASLEAKFELTNRLYHEYKSFVFDSAFQYGNDLIRLSYEMDNGALVGYSKTNLGFTLMSAGMFKEAFDTLSTVVVKDLMDSTKLDYYALMARALYDICDYSQDGYYSPIYVQRADTYVDFVMRTADPTSYHYLYLNGLRDLRIERTDDAIRYLDRLLHLQPDLEGQQFAITASTLSYLHLKLGDTTQAINLLASACISDIENSIKETSALTSLAQLMYETGHVEEAYRYINESMEDAKYYGAIQRMSQVGKVLPVISAAKLNDVEGQRKKLLIYAIGLTVLALLTLSFTVITIRQKKHLSKKDRIIKDNNNQLRDANTQLWEINKIKDEYLGFYFDLNSKYLDKMTKIKKSIESKLVENRYEDIRYILKKTDLKKEKADLFTHFDESFVKIFPDFIVRFNELFEEKDQYAPAKGEILNMELRLFALIRIGIRDSERLASILGYSVNTIYAYKNRIKNQSVIPNSEFEDRIMEIQSKS